MNTTVKILAVMCTASIAALATLAYHRIDRSGCWEEPPSLSGVHEYEPNYCDIYGPRNFYGWPRALEKPPTDISSDAQLADTFASSNRLGFIVNLAVFNAAALTGYGIYSLVRKKRHAHTRH